MARQENNIQTHSDAVMTEGEARKCQIKDLKSYKEGGTHIFWEILVVDEIGNEYVWEDWALGATPTEAQFKTAIYNKVLTLNKLKYNSTREASYDTTTVSESIKDQMVGAEI